MGEMEPGAEGTASRVAQKQHLGICDSKSERELRFVLTCKSCRQAQAAPRPRAGIVFLFSMYILCNLIYIYMYNQMWMRAENPSFQHQVCQGAGARLFGMLRRDRMLKSILGHQ